MPVSGSVMRFLRNRAQPSFSLKRCSHGRSAVSMTSGAGRFMAGPLKQRTPRGDCTPAGRTVPLDGRPMLGVTANPAAGVSVAEARAVCATLAEEVRKELQLPTTYRLTWLQDVATK